MAISMTGYNQRMMPQPTAILEYGDACCAHTFMDGDGMEVAGLHLLQLHCFMVPLPLMGQWRCKDCDTSSKCCTLP